ncbi:hypothetical protein RUM43_011340 [Polyplax serrata]|uniref:Uncharacterized protein n=1 Tax=Polyplax serrata TaxID=468196 RepID=A0AAN8PF07_POLSC
MGKERNSTEDREKQRPVEKVTNTQTGGIRLIALTHNLIFETFHLVTYIGKQSNQQDRKGQKVQHQVQCE